MENEYGEYINGFFIIVLNRMFGDKINLNTISQEDKGTYIHEYIHFLQDISTSSGLDRINQTYKELRGCLARGKRGILNKVDLDKFENRKAMIELYGYYDGDDFANRKNLTQLIIEKSEYDFAEDLFNILPDSLKIGFVCDTVKLRYSNEQLGYNIGRKAIAENMAYLVEHCLVGTQRRINEVPYNACEILCQKIYPSIADKKNIIVAICEVSLMHYNPGLMFYDILLDMKEFSLNFSNVESFWRHYKNRISHLWENYNKELKELKKEVNELYKKENPFFYSVNIYINKTICNAYELRKWKSKNPLFIAQLLDRPKLLTKYMYKFNVGTINGYGLYSYHEDDAIVKLLAAYAVYQIYSTGNKCCYMCEICESVNSQFWDKSCKVNPIEQANKNPMCVLAAFLDSYSMV